MKLYKLPCAWQMYGYMDIDAKSLKDAVSIAEHFLTSLPVGSYVEESFEVDVDVLPDFTPEE